MEPTGEWLQIDLTPSGRAPESEWEVSGIGAGSDGARVLIYSHDTYGLGHLRRSLLIAHRLAELPEVSSILIATGSPLAQSFPLPAICDSVKLPAVTKEPNGRYLSRSLGIPTHEMFSLRAGILEAAARNFSPDLILVDHAPVGAQGELWPLLRWAQSRPNPPRLILGLRDVIDEAERVADEWERFSAWSAVDEMYDRILVYGDPTVLTTAEELGLPSRQGARLRYVGYLTRQVERIFDPAQGLPTVLVSVGGGADGAHVLDTYVEFLESAAAPLAFRSVLVGGPFLPRSRYVDLVDRCRETGQPVDVVSFVGGLERLLSEAAGAVTMGGYNTVAELLGHGMPALIVPREAPRQEQLLRAQRLSSVTNVECCPMGDYGPERLSEFTSGLEQPVPDRRFPLRLDGVEGTAREISKVLTRTESIDRGAAVAS
ncbi:MAG TPA: glycosyltransferase [Acidimicrobiia bacterium]